jgi:uncharacterized protein YciI
MKKLFAFIYFMKNEPDRVKAAVREHVKYWKEKQLNEYFGGPFSDRSGGLITFETDSIETAASIVENDPFVLQELLESRWLKEWMVE